jgi:hypothetical protein
MGAPVIDYKTPSQYVFNNKGYWIAGDVTTDSQMSALAAANTTGTYSGSARGPYYGVSGGTDMSGTFGCSVNFAAGSNQITNFNMNVSGSGKSASITNGTGSFNPASGYKSNFSLSSGTVSITGSAGATQKTSGAMYGSSAQAVGGVWAIDGGAAKAVGMFQGTR